MELGGLEPPFATLERLALERQFLNHAVTLAHPRCVHDREREPHFVRVTLPSLRRYTVFGAVVGAFELRNQVADVALSSLLRAPIDLDSDDQGSDWIRRRKEGESDGLEAQFGSIVLA
jgi:hypothetical protein